MPPRSRSAARATTRLLGTALLTAGLAGPLLAGCERGGHAEPAAAAKADEPVARVDGVPITGAELASRVARVTGGDATSAADAQLRSGLLEQLVEERVLLAEARRRGITIQAADIEAAARGAETAMGPEGFKRELESEGITPEAYRARLGETLLIRALLATAPTPTPITENDVRIFYNEHRADYARPEQFRARLITVPSRAEAEAVRVQLAGGADFATIARSRSTSPEKESGGDLGFVPRGQLPPEFDGALERLSPGQLSGVVQSPYGFHVFRLDERRPPRQAKLEEVRDEIRESLGRGRLESAHERWIVELRAKAKVEILDPALRGGQAAAGPPPAAPAGAKPAPSGIAPDTN